MIKFRNAYILEYEQNVNSLVFNFASVLPSRINIFIEVKVNIILSNILTGYPSKVFYIIVIIITTYTIL